MPGPPQAGACSTSTSLQRPTLRQSRPWLLRARGSRPDLGGSMVLKIAYWTTTIIAAAMLLLAVTYLTGSAQIVAAINHLGYPQHLRVVLGGAKPAAGLVLLVPVLRVLKEWAYAGGSFAMSMAFREHWMACGVVMALIVVVLQFVVRVTR